MTKKGLTPKESEEYKKRVDLIRDKYKFDQTGFQRAIIKIKDELLMKEMILLLIQKNWKKEK